MENTAINKIVDSRISDDELCSVRDICDFFGVSQETLRRWRVSGQFCVKPLPIPVQKKLFRIGDVRNFIRRSSRKH